MLRKYDLSLIRSMVQDELVKSVIMKICLIRNNCIIITIYVCLYIIGNLGLSVMLSGTKNPVAMVFNQCIDSITLVFVLYNLRGRRLLSLYDGVDIMFDEYQSIFKATIESKGLNSAEGIVSVEADKCSVLQESYIPIVVINPGFEGFRNDWDSEYTINGTLGEPRGLMSCVSIGWILQYED